jgi:HlyD family secretion protein
VASSYRRGLFWSVLGAALAAGLIYAFWPQPVPVDLGAVSRGPLEVTVDEEGETQVKDVYLVSAPLGGRLLRIDNEVGDWVEAGETLLASIQPADPAFLDIRSQSEKEALVRAAEAARVLAEAEVERARAELNFAQSDFDRADRLYKRGTVSKRAQESAELEVKTRAAALTSAEAALRVKAFELETARASLISPTGPHSEWDGSSQSCCVEVRAPVSGRILRVIQESESVILSGAPLLEIGDPRALEIIVDLLSADAVKVQEGASVRIEGWGGAQLNGRVYRVEPYGFTKVSALGIEEQRVNVLIDFEDSPEAWQRLGHGYRVEVRIVVWRADEVLRVPIAALFRDGDDWQTFVLSDGVAEKRSIVLGHYNNLAAEVRDGLREGDQVVLHPSDRIGEGTRIVERGQEGY